VVRVGKLRQCTVVVGPRERRVAQRGVPSKCLVQRLPATECDLVVVEQQQSQMRVAAKFGSNHRDAGVSQLVVRHVELLQAARCIGAARQTYHQLGYDFGAKATSETQGTHSILCDQLRQRVAKTNRPSCGCTRRLRSACVCLVIANRVFIVRYCANHSGHTRGGIGTHRFNVGRCRGCCAHLALESSVENQRVEVACGCNQRLYNQRQSSFLELVACQAQAHQSRAPSQALDQCFGSSIGAKVVLCEIDLHSSSNPISDHLIVTRTYCLSVSLSVSLSLALWLIGMHSMVAYLCIGQIYIIAKV
jgi:hypothetical protein